MRQVDISHLLVSSQDLDQTEDVSLCGAFFFAGISSTADVQGRALCPGSTPGAPLKTDHHQSEMIGGFLMRRKRGEPDGERQVR